MISGSRRATAPTREVPDTCVGRRDVWRPEMRIQRIAILPLLGEGEIQFVVKAPQELVADDSGFGSRRIDQTFEHLLKFGLFPFLCACMGDDPQCHDGPLLLSHRCERLVRLTDAPYGEHRVSKRPRGGERLRRRP